MIAPAAHVPSGRKTFARIAAMDKRYHRSTFRLGRNGYRKLTDKRHRPVASPRYCGGMTNASEYRGLAARFRREADDPALSHLRDEKLRAAERWEAVAEEVERAEPSQASLAGPSF